MTKKPKKAAKQRRYAKPSKTTRKKAIARVLSTIVENSDDQEKLEVIEQLITCSLNEMGKHLSLDMDGAIILSADDPGTLLQHAIFAHHLKTGVPLEDVYDHLLEALTMPAAVVN